MRTWPRDALPRRLATTAAGVRPSGLRRAWLALGVAVVLLGSAAAVVAGVAMTRADGGEARRDFATASTSIASTWELAIEHEDDLVVNASAFLAGNTAASTAEFEAWAASTRVIPRYPELQFLGFAVLVPAAELPAYVATLNDDPATALPPGTSFQVLPPGDRPSYCFTRLGIARAGMSPAPPGYDFCAGLSPDVLVARDTGVGSYLAVELEPGVTSFAVQTPIYRGGLLPTSVADRRETFIGWAGVVIDPTVVVDRALTDHPGIAVTLRFGDSEFRSTNVTTGNHSHTIDLDNGWTVQTSDDVSTGTLLHNWSAFALMAVGVGSSLLLGSMILVLSTGRSRALGMVSEQTDELRHQAMHDALTGLPNRSLIMDRIEQLQARSLRNGTPAATLFLDIDGFKTVNDTLGHHAGDRLLQAVADRLTASLRRVDTIGRMGGDEFVVLIDGGEDDDAPAVVAQRILDLVREPITLVDAATPIVVTASIGIAVGRGNTPADALRDADMALYEAKDAGRNRFEVFRPEMEVSMRSRYELELDLRAALAADQFVLAYQPIYNLDDLTIVGVEALVRWQHPVIGEIKPDDFIPLLEASGQIVEVGRWVLDEACAQMAAWRAAGSDLTVSVNVSGRQLDHDGIVDDVRNALRSSGLPAGALTIEVTETALMRSIDETARRLRELKELGVLIAIDDFGTGYSSLAYLQRLPVDCLKIDRSFTEALTRSPESDALVRTLVQLGKDLGMSTLAEGVETTEQIDHLRGQQVTHVQGFLLARPLTPARFEELLLTPGHAVGPTAEPA
ncbi:MAG: EAL domain-containing protein [Ilumatobacteraceae bacterium]